MFILSEMSCGNLDFNFDSIFPFITSTLVAIIMFGVPLLLIILGMLDMGKAVMAQKEDEIKKAQGLFVKRIIAAVLVFLVFTIVQVVFNFINRGLGEGKTNWQCVECFMYNKCGSVK